jgi:hypothetical protein
VDLDPGIADCADGDRKSKALQQRKVDMDIEPLRLEAGKAIGDGLETLFELAVTAMPLQRGIKVVTVPPSRISRNRWLRTSAGVAPSRARRRGGRAR